MRPTKPFAGYAKDNVEAVRRRDRIKALACRIGGLTTKQYRALHWKERSRLTATAREMYELGVDFPTAVRAEKTEARGFLYVIVNPAWPDYVKIGRAFDPESRCRQYQTGTPHRDYKVVHEVYFHDCHWAEREMHARLDPARVGGEWFFMSPQQAVHSINKLRETL